jgi:hypothetical protein
VLLEECLVALHWAAVAAGLMLAVAIASAVAVAAGVVRRAAVGVV